MTRAPRSTVLRIVRRFVPLALVALALAPFAQTQEAGEPTSTSLPAQPPVVQREPGILVGVNYTHVAFDDCGHGEGGVLANYHDVSVRERVVAQLRNMRAAGLESLRMLVWHMTDTGHHRWGVVASRGGRLSDRDRRNLRTFLEDVRQARFVRVTLAFSPQWSNSPLRDQWEEGKLEENRSFISDVRTLALQAELPEVRFDLLNEGGPSAHLPRERFDRLREYDRLLWSWYVDEFGPWDATISSIGATDPRDRGDRLGNLVDALRETGRALPTWFDVHLNTTADGARLGLLAADAALTARGLDLPLVVGEVTYDDPGVASALSEVWSTTGRAVDEVTQWYRRAGSECNVPPPYDGDAYERLGVVEQPVG